MEGKERESERIQRKRGRARSEMKRKGRVMALPDAARKERDWETGGKGGEQSQKARGTLTINNIELPIFLSLVFVYMEKVNQGKLM